MIYLFCILLTVVCIFEFGCIQLEKSTTKLWKDLYFGEVKITSHLRKLVESLNKEKQYDV